MNSSPNLQLVLSWKNGTKWGWDKSPSSNYFWDCRARRSGWVGSTTLILISFTALLTVRRWDDEIEFQRITDLSHSHSFLFYFCFARRLDKLGRLGNIPAAFMTGIATATRSRFVRRVNSPKWESPNPATKYPQPGRRRSCVLKLAWQSRRALA